jgi:hypothetical protein
VCVLNFEKPLNPKQVALIAGGAKVEHALGIAQHNGRARTVAKIREAQARQADR